MARSRWMCENTHNKGIVLEYAGLGSLQLLGRINELSTDLILSIVA
jgi:hypothetical protein